MKEIIEKYIKEGGKLITVSGVELNSSHRCIKKGLWVKLDNKYILLDEEFASKHIIMI
jgi:hypothetical protein